MYTVPLMEIGETLPETVDEYPKNPKFNVAWYKISVWINRLYWLEYLLSAILRP